MAISTKEGGALVQGLGGSGMAEKRIEFVVAADCIGEGESYLRGETRTASEPVYRALRGAGRVCLDDAAAEAAQADLAARQPKAEKPKGKADA